MDLIKKQTFIRADGSTLEADTALSNKELILIYFSAHWCPPCKRFTPILKEFYDKVENSFEWIGAKREDIFVMSFYAWLKSKMEEQPLFETTLKLIEQAQNVN